MSKVLLLSLIISGSCPTSLARLQQQTILKMPSLPLRYIIIVITILAMPNSITSIELYSLGISLGDWIGSEVVAIAASETDGVAVIVIVTVFVARLTEPLALDSK